MIKTELLKLLENIEDGADINEIILGNDEFKQSVQLDISKVTIDEFKKILEENQTIKGYNQSQIDSAVSKGVASYEEKTLPKKVEEELKKANNKDKTPEQIALEELQQKFNALEAEKTKAEMSSKYTKVLTEKGLNIDLIDFILGADDEATNSNIEKLSGIISAIADSKVAEKIKDTAYNPPTGGGGETKNPWSKENFNLTQQAKILQENPTLAKQLMASAK